MFSGLVRSLKANGTLETIAGVVDPAAPWWPASGEALAVRFSGLVSGMVVDGEGNIFVADQGLNRILKISKQPTTGPRTVTLIAGNKLGPEGSGSQGFTADGVDLNDTTRLDQPGSLAFDLDGRLLFTELGNQRVRRIRDGKLETLVGLGTSLIHNIDLNCHTLYGTPKSVVPVSGASQPCVWPLGGLTVGPDGSVYFGEQVDGAANGILRAVRPTGMLELVVGHVTAAPAQWRGGALATTTNIKQAYNDLFFDGGSLFFGDKLLRQIRRVRPDGIVEEMMGLYYDSVLGGTCRS